MFIRTGLRNIFVQSNKCFKLPSLYSFKENDCPSKRPSSSIVDLRNFVRQQVRGFFWSSPKILMEPAGKVAVITGGCNEIGYAVAHQLLCEKVSKVMLTGGDGDVCCDLVDKLNKEHGPDRAEFMKANIACKNELEEVFKFMTCQYKHVDIFFNNEAVVNDKKWEDEIDINIKGMIQCLNIALKYMGKSKGGNGGIIINRGSIFSFDALPTSPTFCIAKHAVIGMTKSYGHDLHCLKTNVRVVSLCPGVISPKLKAKIDCNEDTIKTLQQMPKQDASAVARALVYLVQYAPSDTHWICDKATLYEARVPSLASISKKIGVFK